MEKDLSLNQIEIAIAEVEHTLKCIEEAEEKSNDEIKQLYIPEKQRLTKLLNKLLKTRKEMK